MNKHSQFEGKKATFAELITAEAQTQHNSNMLNLVSAVRSIDDYVDQYQAEISRLLALKSEIQDFADAGDVSDTNIVKDLYKRVNDSNDFCPTRRHY